MRQLAVIAALLAAAATMTGCKTTVPKYLRDVDTSGREQFCVDRCIGIFNSCAGDGGISGVPNYQVLGCKRSYANCIDACPKL
jgi:hypothetical protein